MFQNMGTMDLSSDSLDPSISPFPSMYRIRLQFS